MPRPAHRARALRNTTPSVRTAPPSACAASVFALPRARRLQRPSPLRTPAVATAGQTSSRGAHAPTLKDVAQLSRHAARETRMRCIALSLRALPFGVALREYEDERGREGDSGVAQALPVLIYLLVPTLFPLSSFTPRLCELDLVHVCTEIRIVIGLIYFVQTSSQQVQKIVLSIAFWSVFAYLSWLHDSDLFFPRMLSRISDSFSHVSRRSIRTQISVFARWDPFRSCVLCIRFLNSFVGFTQRGIEILPHGPLYSFPLNRTPQLSISLTNPT
jgi:hypothetical protein